MPFAKAPEFAITVVLPDNWDDLSDLEQDLLLLDAEDLIHAHLVWQDLERRFGPERR